MVSLKEKHNIIEDSIYCLVVKRFKESNISMIRYVSSAFEPALIHPNRWKITHYPEVPPGSLEAKLETIHTREALEVIYDSITVIPPHFLYHRTETQDVIEYFFSKSELGNIYADSVVFAYALKQIQKWYKREKLENSFTYGGLRAYMERWNKKSYDLLSRVRSLEASLLIGKHVNALFGRLHKKVIGGIFILESL
jgi:hypothetical protein